MPDRSKANRLAEQYLAAGEPTGLFEALYASAGGDASTIPWADLKPNPNLMEWLGRHALPVGGRALVVGCGLGDDAEELARRGMRVTAFDVAPSAVEWCRRRFPESAVSYAVADVLQPPAEWRGAFDFVLESYTLQALPPQLRPSAMGRIAECLAPGGSLLVICRAPNPSDPEGAMPWPLTRAELGAFVSEAGLVEETVEDYFDNEEPPVRRFRATFRRPGQGGMRAANG